MMLFMALDSGGFYRLHYAEQPSWFPLRPGGIIRQARTGDDGQAVADDWLALHRASWNERAPFHLAMCRDGPASLRDERESGVRQPGVGPGQAARLVRTPC